ncbi:hypothetical protein [Phaeospirillum tilakii]|uniref:Uncharacterized protein n=1 Tax=Phaeospirillum tilakii TaxID=741673 RepID=A0ABW5C8N7_9PROT
MVSVSTSAFPTPGPAPASALAPDGIEHVHCPECGRKTPHRVSRERVVAPVLWCLSCFHLHVERKDESHGAS